MKHDSFDQLRTEIRAVDREIVTLLARRAGLARDIGGAKAALGLPIRDYGTEKRVIARIRETCEELQVDPAWGESVARELIRGAIQVQEDFHGSLPAGTLRDVLVVGGGGKMGAWLARFFANAGHRVRVCDPSTSDLEFPEAALEEAATAEVVVLAVPLDAGEEVLDRVTALAPRGLVFDIGSLKAPISPAISRARERGVRVTSLHPMFGPGVRMLSGRAVLVCDCGDAQAMDLAEELFADTALSLRRVGLEEHDGLMAVALGMSHALAIVGFTALRDMGIGLSELLGGASTTLLQILRTMAEVARENPDLYYEIQHRNPATPEVYRVLGAAVTRLRDASLAEQPGEFRRVMELGREFFGELELEQLPG